MSKFHKAVEIVEKLGFEFVKTDQEANIIIKTPDEIIPSENKRKYQRWEKCKNSTYWKNFTFN